MAPVTSVNGSARAVRERRKQSDSYLKRRIRLKINNVRVIPHKKTEPKLANPSLATDRNLKACDNTRCASVYGHQGRNLAILNRDSNSATTMLRLGLRALDNKARPVEFQRRG